MEQNIQDTLEAVSELKEQTVITYARLWQLETWLRRMAYVELRTKYGDLWSEKLQGRAPSWAFRSDKRLTHMPTPEQTNLSYIPLGDLSKTILAEWSLFEPYLPPQTIWEARLEEVSQVRHRIAHCRSGHKDDLQRVVQLLRDVDRGFWRFCTSYNDSFPILPPIHDPVIDHFIEYDQHPYTFTGYTSTGQKAWARVGVKDPAAIVDVRLEVARRPWCKQELNDHVAGTEGFFYNLLIFALRQRVFDYDKFLRNSEGIHHHLTHICLACVRSHIRVTIPCVIGEELIVDLISNLLEFARWSLIQERSLPQSTTIDFKEEHDRETEYLQAIADEWPEHVLGPKNPLTFLCPDMECSFFTI